MRKSSIPRGYMSAVGRLYGDDTNICVKTKKPRKTSPRALKIDCAKEHQEQATFVDWLDIQGLVYHSVPNEGKRSYGYSARLTRTGLQAGVPDIVIPIRRGQYGCCYIEMKRRIGGRLSEAQKAFIPRLLGAGNFVYIAAGAEEAIRITGEYLAGKPVWSNLKKYL